MQNFFSIKYDGNDLSKKLNDFGTASVGLELTDDKYIYVGYYKPFNQFFTELSTKNTSGGIMSAEYYDGDAWQSLASLIDETEDFSKSGFFFFEKPSAWKTYENLFYIRLKTSVSHSVGTSIQGLGILLSNDLDLEGIRSNIVTKFNSGASWVLKHEQARKDIMQLMRNKGNRVVKNANDLNPLVTEGARFADLTEFDLLRPEQLRQASMYKVLSMIYLDELSDNEDDKWQRQGDRYEKTFHEMFNLFYLQIDSDDDGLESDSESYATTSTSLSWR